MEKITNHSVIFVLAYLLVFAVAQISTILSAFSHEVPVIVYSSYLDFNSLTSAASDEVWQSKDNVINIFGSAIILLLLLMTISIILLLRWKTKKVWIQRLLFWVSICSFVRFCDSFICGHIFYLWSFNLVTDFIGLTFPSNIMRTIFVIFIVVLLGVGMYFLRELIVGILNPCKENLKKQLKTNVIYPSIIGSGIILLVFFPITNKAGITEVANILVTPLCLASLFRLGVAKKFAFINSNDIKEVKTKEKIFIPLIVVGLILILSLRLVFDEGVKITPNVYDNYFLNNLLSFVVVGLLTLLALYLVIAYYHHHKKQKQEEEEELKAYKSFEQMKDYNMFDYNKSKNLCQVFFYFLFPINTIFYNHFSDSVFYRSCVFIVLQKVVNKLFFF
jgi:hypothetical protein